MCGSVRVLRQNGAQAIDVFEAVAASSLDVALLKWSVKDYFFQAL